MTKKNLFTCKICGSHSYHEVRESTDFVGQKPRKVLYYVCDDCSVHFEDPEKFSRTRYNYISAELDKMAQIRAIQKAEVEKRLSTPSEEDPGTTQESFGKKLDTRYGL